MTQSLPDAVRVVVIGGGVMGCSTLYHLAKLGVRDIVLLERKQLTCGTTWHSSAQVRQLRSTNNLTDLIRHSIDLYAGLEAETGQATGWVRTGTLNIATTRDRMIHLERQASLGRVFGVETHMLGSREAADLWPLMRADDIVGAAYCPNDGRVNPSDLCAALVKGAKMRGARVFEETEVVGFDIRGGRVHGVRTTRGDIRCEAVANCAGLWAGRLGAMAGVSVPIFACEHFYLLTKSIESLGSHLPTLGDPDGYLYIRDEVGGIIAGCFEPNPKLLPLDKLPPDFAFDLLNEDWDHFEPMMMNALHRIPALETAEVKMLLNGPESFTPDGLFLLGEAPELNGYFLGCGMNSMGIANAGGAGMALAQWIVDGVPSMDLWSVDVRRFARFHSNETVLRERIPEILGLHYAIAYPDREPGTARNLRRTPLHDRLVAKGAEFGTRMGWERASWFVGDDDVVPASLTFGRPAWFEAAAAECKAAREGIALFDQSPFGKLMVQGPDAESMLQRLCANNMAVKPGKVVYTGMLNGWGGYESDLTIFRLAEERYLLVTGAAQIVRDEHWILSNVREEERVTLTDVTSAFAVLGVAGPKSRTLLERLTHEDLGNNSFAHYTVREIELGHAMVLAARLSYTGELGWELYVPAEAASGLYDELIEAGADLGLRHAGTHALASLRIEKGFRAWGHDLTPDDTPLEAGLEFAVKNGSNIPFIGCDALLEQRREGVRRRLVHFRLLDSSVFPFGNEAIICDGDVVGQVTSAAFGYSVGASVAMGYVRNGGHPIEQMIAESKFEIEYASERFRADASLAPFYDPRGERAKL